MDKFDDRFLAYAMAVGSYFSLLEPAKGDKKPITSVSIDSLRNTARDKSRADEIAYYIVRQWPQRKVSIKKAHLGAEWIIRNEATGARLRFLSSIQSEIRSEMKLAEEGFDQEQLLSISEVKERLAESRVRQQIKTLNSRMKAWVWPPKEGSLPARALSLAKHGESFEVVTSPDSDGDGDYKKASARGFVAKLKDPSLHLSKLVEHPGESKFAQGMEWRLEPGDVLVDATFSNAKDPKEWPVRRFFWFVDKKIYPTI